MKFQIKTDKQRLRSRTEWSMHTLASVLQRVCVEPLTYTYSYISALGAMGANKVQIYAPATVERIQKQQ